MQGYPAHDPFGQMTRITFSTAQAALAHQEQHGGWVFVSDRSANADWFDASAFTAGAVMRAVAGSGRLI